MILTIRLNRRIHGQVCFSFHVDERHVQSGVCPGWLFRKLVNRVDQAKEEQPHWLTSVVTTTPRLEEEFRFDQSGRTFSGEPVRRKSYPQFYPQLVLLVESFNNLQRREATSKLLETLLI